MRRESLWVGVGTATSVIGTTQTALLTNSANAALLALRPFTIVRSRGTLRLGSDQAANTENQSIAYGAAVVSDQAVAIGVTAVPTPITDQGSDLWYVYETLLSRIVVSSAVGILEPPIWKDYDSRAMRKVEDGQTRPASSKRTQH